LTDLLWSLLVIAAHWLAAVAGVLVGDWRDRRAGRPIDRGYWPD
jgi:hypothetical protein